VSSDTVTERLTAARNLLYSGDPRAAIEAADAIAADSANPGERAWALLLRLASVVNLERSTEYASTVDRAFAAVRALGDPTATGGFHALAAFAAHADGSLERCITHLVRSMRSLAKVERADRQAAIAWHNLAVVFSYIGFHDHAAHAAAQTREVAAAAGLGWSLNSPEVQVRHALSLDHRGDSDGCVRVLRALLKNAIRLPSTEDGLPGLNPMDLPWIGYAAARMELLGHSVPIDVRRCLAAGGNDAWTADLRHFGRICLAISSGDTESARRRLRQATSTAAVLGAAESPRLRALSFLAEGDHATAYQADRETFAAQARVNDQLRRFFVDAVATRLDHEELRRRVVAYGEQATTDPLTGLPNRRHLHEYVNDLAARGEPAVLGVVDLDGFNRINSVHGHLSGDTVLQRAAGALMRVMRRGDFVARYGGDQFVLVLKETPLVRTDIITDRIRQALDDEDWNALVPGTELTAAIGWAEIAAGAGPQGVPSAFSLADEAMRQAKQTRHRA